MVLLDIGFGNVVNADRVISMVSPDSAPIKRIVTDAKERGLVIDASYGRKTKTVIVTDSGHVILSSLEPDVLAKSMKGSDSNA